MTSFPFERVQHRTVEQINDVAQFAVETVEALTPVPCERVHQQKPQLREETAEALRLILHERVHRPNEDAPDVLEEMLESL